MNPAEFERLGTRNSVGAFLGLLISALGTTVLLIGVSSLVVTDAFDLARTTTVFAEQVVAVGRTAGGSLDALAGISATVILGFYVAVIGGQFASGLDVVALRSRLSTIALMLAACFCCTALTRSVAAVAGGAVGVAVVSLIECALIAALAVEVSSWALLSKSRRVEQDRRVINRSRDSIRRVSGLLSPGARRRPVRQAVVAIVATSSLPVILAISTAGPFWPFVWFVFVLSIMAQGTLFFVSLARTGEGPRWFARVAWLVPIALFSLVALSSAYFFSAGFLLAGIAVLTALLIAGAVYFPCVGGFVGIELSLRDLALRVELAEAVRARRRALQRLAEAEAEAEAEARSESMGDAQDERALLDWLRGN